jgi:carbon-monoxide dehydrogenase medium subunit
MKPTKFDYLAPDDCADACRELAADSEATKLVAGAQSLGPMLNLRLARPGRLVDVSMLPALRESRETAGGAEIGAAVTHAEIEDGDVVDPTGGWLRQAAANIAHRAVRNRGTLGGSLGHADPAADWVIVMTGLGATVLLNGPAGRREMPVSSFITGPFQTALGAGELIEAVRVATPGANARWGYCKFVRQVGEFAKASATVLVDPDNGPPRIAVGALGRQPLVFEDNVAQELIAGRSSSEAALAAALPERSTAELVLHRAILDKAMAEAASNRSKEALA